MRSFSLENSTRAISALIKDSPHLRSMQAALGLPRSLCAYIRRVSVRRCCGIISPDLQ